MHEKTGPQESKLYVPLYHASAYPSSDVEAMGVVRVSIVPSLLHTVDRAGLALLLSYVTQAVAGLTPPGTTTTEVTASAASTFCLGQCGTRAQEARRSGVMHHRDLDAP